MKTSSKVLIGVAALTLVGTGVAAAKWQDHRRGGHAMAGKLFERADTNGDGALTLAEVTERYNAQFLKADADQDQSVNKAEMISAIEIEAGERRFARFSGSIADRLMYRLDMDDSGDLSREELKNRVEKTFAFLDFNDDGKIERREIRRSIPMGRHMGRHGGRFGKWGDGRRHESETEIDERDE